MRRVDEAQRVVGDDPTDSNQQHSDKENDNTEVPSPTQKGAHDQEKAAAYQREIQRQERIALIAARRWFRRGRNSAKFYIESVAALATLAIAILTGVYVQYSRQQWQTMSRQMNDYEAGEAAAIAIKNFAIEDFPDNPQVVFELKNEGRTRGDQISPVIASGTIAPKDEAKLFIQEHALGMMTPNINGFSLDPSDPPRRISSRLMLLGFYMPSGMQPPADILKKLPTKEQLMKGDPVVVYVTVDVGYLDIFGNARQTSDCLVYNPQAKLFEPCIAQHDRHGY